MKKKFLFLLSVVLVVSLTAVIFVACDNVPGGTNPDKGGADTTEKTFYEDMTFDYLYGVIDSANNYTIVTEEKDYD